MGTVVLEDDLVVTVDSSSGHEFLEVDALRFHSPVSKYRAISLGLFKGFDDTERKYCMNQFRELRSDLRVSGQGNCSICKPDPERNRHCPGYQAVKIGVGYLDIGENS